jgi:hypothetical protein
VRARAWLVALTVVALGCGRAPAAGPRLEHDAYVWQRAWTGAVAASVAAPPAAIGRLRVLVAEIDTAATMATPAVAVAALVAARRPVIAVVRVDGARLVAGLSLAPALAQVARWRAAGVDVVGLEIDHDCATAALADYAHWLAANRPPAPLAWSITALPTWADAPALPAVAAAVDELVVQVHAVRAPAVFAAATARRDLARFAAAVPGARLRVALPTYAVTIGGAPVRAEPDEVAGFVRALERRPVPGVRGVAWFRLPVAGDRTAWSAATLAAVISGAPLVERITAHAVRRQAEGWDLVLRNGGTRAGRWPDVRVGGDVAASDLVGGYLPAPTPRAWLAPRRELQPGDEVVIGWATGQEVSIDAM